MEEEFPRYQIISEYAGSPFKIGDILVFDVMRGPYRSTSKEYMYLEGPAHAIEPVCKAFPDIFKPLQ